MLDVDDLTGGGGTERYFADVFSHYHEARAGEHDLWLITDPVSVERLRGSGRLCTDANVLVLSARPGPTASLRWAVELRRLCTEHVFDLLHVSLVTPAYLPFLWRLGFARRRPRISITEVDCTLAHHYFERARKRTKEERKAYWLYRIFFETVRIDGVLTWYRLFEERFRERGIRSRPLIAATRYCFVDTETFRPADLKENVIVFAGRLVSIKRPLFFVEAVRLALTRDADAFRGWRFVMYGKGPLESEVREALAAANLEKVVEVRSGARLDEVLARSRVFVSTQDYENFTSLSMLEAMAAGNAIIARDVGQTRAFVRDGENGLVIVGDSPAALANALIEYATHPERHARFAARSREIAETEHCVGNALAEIDRYWSAVRLAAR